MFGWLENVLNRVADMISKRAVHGKTKHPGLYYFGAKKWLRFADMHFRQSSQTKEKKR